MRGRYNRAGPRLAGRNRHGLAVAGTGLIDREDCQVGVHRIVDICVTLGIGQDAIEEVADFTIERVVAYQPTIRSFGRECSEIVCAGQGARVEPVIANATFGAKDIDIELVWHPVFDAGRDFAYAPVCELHHRSLHCWERRLRFEPCLDGTD